MSSPTPAVKTARTNNLTPAHRSVLNVLSSNGQTLAAIATVVGIAQDLCERQLSLLVDENLARRTVGGRTTALYTVA
jgi:hypothetical protein